jgi:hypothetical protein
VERGLVEQQDLGAGRARRFEGDAAQLAAAERFGALVDLRHEMRPAPHANSTRARVCLTRDQ